jgi:hypothetical protein
VASISFIALPLFIGMYQPYVPKGVDASNFTKCGDASIDPEHYAGKDVLVLGKGAWLHLACMHASYGVACRQLSHGGGNRGVGSCQLRPPFVSQSRAVGAERRWLPSLDKSVDSWLLSVLLLFKTCLADMGLAMFG